MAFLLVMVKNATADFGDEFMHAALNKRAVDREN